MGSGMTTNRQVSKVISIDGINYYSLLYSFDLQLKTCHVNPRITLISRPKSILLPQLWYLDNTGQV